MPIAESTNNVIIIQARMSSVRFPGKVLERLMDKPLLEHVIERVRKSSVKHVVLATSTEHSDNPIEVFCQSKNIDCIRGNLNDVASRFELVIKRTRALKFVRICADSPLIDPFLIDQAVEMANSKKADIVTNVFPRTFPKGQSVEVVHADTFSKAIPFFSIQQREHVTKYFYDNAKQFKIENFSSGGSWNHLNMSIDTPSDMARIEMILKNSGEDVEGKGWQELMNLINKSEAGQ